jgi:uncharacterized protein (DUF2345 family)
MVKQRNQAQGPVKAGDNLNVRAGGGMILAAKNDMTISQGGGTVLHAGRDMRISQGGGTVLVAGEDITLSQGGGAVLIARQAEIGKGWIGLLLSGKVTLSEGARVLIATPQAVLLGATLGLVFALFNHWLRRSSNKGRT